MSETVRKIIHIDMDAFYASIEQRDFPQYRNKPLIVGGPPDSRGVVAACSYEARNFGIHSAMPSSQAYRRCPDAIFLRPRFEIYQKVSRQIHKVFLQYTELVEPLSLDEAYLDVSDTLNFQGSATLIAKEIKAKIRSTTNLTASAGVSYNKFLAKIASDMDKPDGLFVITPKEGPSLVRRLPIGKFYGIGKATEFKMKTLGINTGAQLKTLSLARLEQTFGKLGLYYYHAARGVDKRPVRSQQARRSLGSETTFESDLTNLPQMLSHLNRLAKKVMANIEKKQLAGRTLSIKVKYDNFKQITRSITFDSPLQSLDEISQMLPHLLEKTEAGQRKVRLLGVTISNFDQPPMEEKQQQLTLF